MLKFCGKLANLWWKGASKSCVQLSPALLPAVASAPSQWITYEFIHRVCRKTSTGLSPSNFRFLPLEIGSFSTVSTPPITNHHQLN